MAPWATAKAARTSPVTSEGLRLVTQPAQLVHEGNPVAFYLTDVFDAARFTSVLGEAKSAESVSTLKVSNRKSIYGAPSGASRLSGITAPSVTFGSLQAAPVRRRFSAAPCRANTTQPRVYAAVLALLSVAWQQTQRLNQPWGDHANTINNCWKLAGTPFTSAILNLPGSPYPYHKDSGNVVGSWSIMPVVRGDGAGGGHLVLPEYGCALACDSGSVVGFPGATEWHGVTPIDGERWSIVFYAKAGLVDAADTYEAELRAGNLRRTEYETKDTA